MTVASSLARRAVGAAQRPARRVMAAALPAARTPIALLPPTVGHAASPVRHQAFGSAWRRHDQAFGAAWRRHDQAFRRVFRGGAARHNHAVAGLRVGLERTADGDFGRAASYELGRARPASPTARTAASGTTATPTCGPACTAPSGTAPGPTVTTSSTPARGGAAGEDNGRSPAGPPGAKAVPGWDF